jgi:hypothetical protein
LISPTEIPCSRIFSYTLPPNLVKAAMEMKSHDANEEDVLHHVGAAGVASQVAQLGFIFH